MGIADEEAADRASTVIMTATVAAVVRTQLPASESDAVVVSESTVTVVVMLETPVAVMVVNESTPLISVLCTRNVRLASHDTS